MLFELIVSLVVAAAVAQLATFGTTIYLHRTVAHKSIVLHPAAAWFFRFSLWLTTGILTREWVAVHRKHHSFTDEEGDPHSPLLEGFWSVQLGNIYFYVRESRKKEVVEKYAKDVQDDFGTGGCLTTDGLARLLGQSVSVRSLVLDGGCLRLRFIWFCIFLFCRLQLTDSATTLGINTLRTRRGTLGS